MKMEQTKKIPQKLKDTAKKTPQQKSQMNRKRTITI